MKQQEMKVLIAGGAGFVGSNLAISLKQRYKQYEVSVLDNLSRQGSQLNVARLQQQGIAFHRLDTRFAGPMQKLGHFDVIIDAAAEPSVLAGLDSGLDYLVRTNFNGTVNLLNLARRSGAAFLFLSTSRVYPYNNLSGLLLQDEGDTFSLGKLQPVAGVSQSGVSEAFPITGPRTLYGATKLSSELMVQEYHTAFGLKTVINRCGVIAGPWQMGKVDQGVAALWLARHYWKRPLKYIGFGGRGLQVRDMLHIDDLFRLVDYQIHHPDVVNGETYNAGGGPQSSASLQQLTEICRSLTGNVVPIAASAEHRPGDIPWYITDNSRVMAATGWKPEKGVREIMTDMLRWIRENEDVLKPVLDGS